MQLPMPGQAGADGSGVGWFMVCRLGPRGGLLVAADPRARARGATYGTRPRRSAADLRHRARARSTADLRHRAR